METTHMPGNEPDNTTTNEELDLSVDARLERIREVEGRLAAGATVTLNEVNPKTHSPELVARVGQVVRHGRRALGL